MKKLFQKLQPTTHKLQTSKGFTMVELLIYMGILTIVVVLLTDVLTSITDSQLHSQNASNVADDGRFIYSRLVYDISRADSVTEPVAEGNSSSTLRLLIGGQEYIYTLSNGDLTLTTPSGTDKLNGYGTIISNLQFTKVGTVDVKSTVKIGFTVTGLITVRGVNDVQNFNTTVGLR